MRASPDQDTIDLRFYWRQMRKRPWLILALVLVSLTLGGLYVAKTRPLFRATTKILIEQDSAKVAPFEDLVAPGQTAAHYETQYQILESRALARRVISSLNLKSHPEFAPKTPEAGVVRQTVQRWIAWLRQTLSSLVPPPQVSEPSPPMPPLAVSDPEETALINKFLERLQVKSDPKDHLVSVSFEAHDPNVAASATNALARLYSDFNREMRFAELQEALDWLQRQVGDMRHQVEASERTLEQYKDQHDVHLIDERLPGLIQEIAALNESLSQAKTERIELETLHKEIELASAEGKSMEWMPTVVDNQLIQNLKTRYVDIQRAFVLLSQKYGEEHPRVVQLQAQMSAVEDKINKEVDKIVQAFNTQYRVVQSRERALLDYVERLRQDVRDFNDKAVRYGILKREAESNRHLGDLLLNRLKEASMSSDLTSGTNIRIIDAAEVPTQPINVRPALTLGLAGILGLVVGVGLVAFMGYLDNTLKTPDEAEEFLGLPVLGAIERFRRRRGARRGGAEALVTTASPRSQASEAFKTLRTNLLFSYTDPPRKVYLVTSPHPGDGKTTVAANLAVVMAQMERRVLLVDADLRHPTVHLVFEIDGQVGLSQLLLTEAYDNIAASDDNLSIIPAGEIPPNPSELLGSKRMQRFLAFAREHYDTVIIDSPPILAVGDAVMLSRLVDEVLMVLRAGATPYDHARRAIAGFFALQAQPTANGDHPTASKSDVTSLGLVMNFLDPREGASYGYYGYHSYYYHGGDKSAHQVT